MKIWNELSPKGVAVSLKAQHLCMCMRGVKKHDTWTTTTKLLGVFKEDDKARAEFLRYIQ
jgi:GTP cyclohydrolase I